VAESDINTYVGDTTVLEVKIYKNDELLDLSDYLVLFTVKQSFIGAISTPAGSDATATLKKNSEASGGIEKISNGIARITINSSDTDGLLAGEYLYDVQISKQGNPTTVFTVISGKINLKSQITSRTGSS